MIYETQVFEAGDYSRYGYSNYSEADMTTIADRTNMYGVKPLQFFSEVYDEDDIGVPITAEHADTENIINLGYADRFYPKGGQLWATLNIPDGINENLNKLVKGVSVEINPHSKVINKVTLTRKPLIATAKFSDSAVSGIKKDENIEMFSLDISQEVNMADHISKEAIEETQEEVVEIEATTEAVAVEEEVIEQVETEEVEAVEAMSETEALKAKLEAIEKEMESLREEKITAEAESYSKSAVSQGVPPVIAKLLSPYIVRGKVEAFSETHGEFGGVAKEILDFFCKDDAFRAKLPTNEADEYIRGEGIEGYSEDAILARVRKDCERNGIKVGSREYNKRLAVEAARGV